MTEKVKKAKVATKKKTAAKKVKKKQGRPSKFTPKICDEIIEALLEHPLLTLKKICKLYPHFPDASNIYLYRSRDASFHERFKETLKLRSEIAVEEMENYEDDLLHYYDSEGNKRIDSPSMSLMSIKIANKKWFAARLAPKLYGDAKELEAAKDENASLKEELKALRQKLQEQNESDY